MYYRDMPGLKQSFENNYLVYNESVDFIENPPTGVTIYNLAPKKILKSGTYSYSKRSIMKDYRYGIDIGIQHLMSV